MCIIPLWLYRLDTWVKEPKGLGSVSTSEDLSLGSLCAPLPHPPGSWTPGIHAGSGALILYSYETVVDLRCLCIYLWLKDIVSPSG